MPLFRAIGSVSGSKYLGEFEAKDEEAALELAYDSDACRISLCHQCIKNCEDPEIGDIHVELVEPEKKV